MDRFTGMELFVRTADYGTLSKAAESLNLSIPTASRHLAALEKRLKVRLIDRNTRRLALTGAGNEFYRRCKSLLMELKEAEAAANATLVDPVGTLTITSSISFAKIHLAPLLPAFANLYPGIRIKLLGQNRYFDILDSDIDLAIRTREFEPDSNIVIRKLAESRRVLAASPDYLARAGLPGAIQDLGQHRMLIYSYANNPMILNFNRREAAESIKIEPAMESNDGQILVAAALAGAGILVQPKYIIQQYLSDGQLVSVLDDWDLPRLTINIAFQHRRYMPAKTRLFIEFLIEHFRTKQYERQWTQ